MPAMIEKTMAGGQQVWSGWQKHCSALRLESYFAILESLRQNYPDHVVTIAPEETGLLKYAEAKNAEIVLDEEDDRYAVWRTYKSGDRRSGHESGEVKDDMKFGKYSYTWKGQHFIVYHTKYVVNRVFDRQEELFFILSERQLLRENETRPQVVDELIATASKWNQDLHDEIYVYDRECWTKSKQLWKSVQQSDWNDVIMDPVVKKEIISDVEGFFDNEAEYREYAVAYKRGIILHGPPGNGKSLTIKALIHSLAKRPDPIPSLYVKSINGCSKEWYNIREVFEKARAMTPCLLIFEDLDSMVTENVRSFFLNEVDGLEDNDGLLILGSTNYLERLDPSIAKRPSRFDRKYPFTLPSFNDRVRYAEYWQGKLARNNRVDFPEDLARKFAENTDGFSFAYLKEVFVTSLLSIVGAHRTGQEIPDGVDEFETENPFQADDTVGELAGVLLWRVIRKQISVLRKEMEEADASEKAKQDKDKSGDQKGSAEEGSCC